MYRADKASIKDIEYILDNLRYEDELELKTIRGENWKNEIISDLKNSNKPFILAKTKKDDTPVLIAGCWSVDGASLTGVVWMLSTPEIEKHQISFLRELKKEIKLYDEEFAFTYNHIYKSNHLAKKWLKKVGYRFPTEEKQKTFLDKEFAKIESPKDFEFFYRERPLKGLGE